MPEMLPCPLSLNRYNPTFKPTEEDAKNGQGCQSGGDYLDPDRDYEVIASLREGLLGAEGRRGEFEDEEHIYQ